jgi:hypothetical protein
LLQSSCLLTRNENVLELQHWSCSRIRSVTAAPPVLSIWPCKTKFDEEKLKHARLAQQNGFGPAF